MIYDPDNASHVAARYKFASACNRVLRAQYDNKSDHMTAAVEHANIGLRLAARDPCEMFHIEIRALYLLNNLGRWRGEDAQTAKAELRGIHDLLLAPKQRKSS